MQHSFLVYVITQILELQESGVSYTAMTINANYFQLVKKLVIYDAEVGQKAILYILCATILLHNIWKAC